MTARSTDRPSIVLMAAYTNYRRDPRVRREAEALVEAGHRVTFLASRQPGEPVRETIDGVEVIKLPKLNKRRTSMLVYLLDYALFFVLTMMHLIRHPRRYSLIHVNNMPDFLVFAAWLPRLLGTPVIHDVHDLMPELFAEKFGSGERHWVVGALRAQERWAGRFATAVLTVESRLKDILATRGVPLERIHVLMNLPDDRIFARRPAMGVRSDNAPFVLVYHGTLARRLGLDIAIRAVARARAVVPNIVFRIIGAGEEREALVALRDELQLDGAVTFSDGFVPVQAIPALIADADVGVIPLRISGGTDIMLPTKLLEYVAMGIPCIAPKTRTIARYFDESMLAFFEPEDVESLAAAIVALHRDAPRRESIAHEATRRFAEPYQWRVHKKVYTDLVARLIARPEDMNVADAPADAPRASHPRSSTSNDGTSRLTTSGRFLKVMQIPEEHEDFVDLHDPEAVIASLAKSRRRPDILSFWQRLPDTQPRYAYPMEWDNVAAIRIHSYKEWIDKAVHPSVRTKLRKSQKLGVSVALMPFDDELVRGMAGIFNETPIRQGRPYSHYGKGIDSIRSEWGVDMDFSVFVGATFDGELIGFVKLSFTERYAEMSGTICKLAHRDKPAMTALIARSVQFCEERGIPYLCYGKFVYGRKGEDSLSDFKRHNGFQRIDIPRYFVPLTLWGRIALKLGLHRGLTQCLPPRVHQRLIDARARYWRWRLAPAA